MFRRTPGRIRKLLRNVSGMPVSSPLVVWIPGSDTPESDVHGRMADCPLTAKKTQLIWNLASEYWLSSQSIWIASVVSN